RVAGGYICKCCLPEYRTVFADREALWADHLFEPFLEWVNNDLAKAKTLVLHGIACEVTWARILDDKGHSLSGGGYRFDLRLILDGKEPEKRPGYRILLPCREHESAAEWLNGVSAVLNA